MSKYYQLPIRIISIIVLVAFLATQCGLDYAQDSLSDTTSSKLRQIQEAERLVAEVSGKSVTAHASGGAAAGGYFSREKLDRYAQGPGGIFKSDTIGQQIRQAFQEGAPRIVDDAGERKIEIDVPQMQFLNWYERRFGFISPGRPSTFMRGYIHDLFHAALFKNGFYGALKARLEGFGFKPDKKEIVDFLNAFNREFGVIRDPNGKPVVIDAKYVKYGNNRMRLRMLWEEAAAKYMSGCYEDAKVYPMYYTTIGVAVSRLEKSVAICEILEGSIDDVLKKLDHKLTLYGIAQTKLTESQLINSLAGLVDVSHLPKKPKGVVIRAEAKDKVKYARLKARIKKRAGDFTDKARVLPVPITWDLGVGSVFGEWELDTGPHKKFRFSTVCDAVENAVYTDSNGVLSSALRGVFGKEVPFSSIKAVEISEFQEGRFAGIFKVSVEVQDEAAGTVKNGSFIVYASKSDLDNERAKAEFSGLVECRQKNPKYVCEPYSQCMVRVKEGSRVFEVGIFSDQMLVDYWEVNAALRKKAFHGAVTKAESGMGVFLNKGGNHRGQPTSAGGIDIERAIKTAIVKIAIIYSDVDKARLLAFVINNGDFVCRLEPGQEPDVRLTSAANFIQVPVDAEVVLHEKAQAMLGAVFISSLLLRRETDMFVAQDALNKTVNGKDFEDFVFEPREVFYGVTQGLVEKYGEEKGLKVSAAWLSYYVSPEMEEYLKSVNPEYYHEDSVHEARAFLAELQAKGAATGAEGEANVGRSMTNIIDAGGAQDAAARAGGDGLGRKIIQRSIPFGLIEKYRPANEHDNRMADKISDIIKGIMGRIDRKAPSFFHSDDIYYEVEDIIDVLLKNAVDAVYEGINDGHSYAPDASAVRFEFFVDRQKGFFYMIVSDRGPGIRLKTLRTFGTDNIISRKTNKEIGGVGWGVKQLLEQAQENGWKVVYESKRQNNKFAYRFIQLEDGTRRIERCGRQEVGTTVIISGSYAAPAAGRSTAEAIPSGQLSGVAARGGAATAGADGTAAALDKIVFSSRGMSEATVEALHDFKEIFSGDVDREKLRKELRIPTNDKVFFGFRKSVYLPQYNMERWFSFIWAIAELIGNSIRAALRGVLPAGSVSTVSVNVKFRLYGNVARVIIFQDACNDKDWDILKTIEQRFNTIGIDYLNDRTARKADATYNDFSTGLATVSSLMKKAPVLLQYTRFRDGLQTDLYVELPVSAAGAAQGAAARAGGGGVSAANGVPSDQISDAVARGAATAGAEGVPVAENTVKTAERIWRWAESEGKEGAEPVWGESINMDVLKEMLKLAQSEKEGLKAAGTSSGGKIDMRIEYIFTYSVISAAQRSGRFSRIDFDTMKELLFSEGDSMDQIGDKLKRTKEYVISLTAEANEDFAGFVRFFCPILAEAEVYGYSHQHVFWFDTSHLFGDTFGNMVSHADRALLIEKSASMSITQPLGVFLDSFSTGNIQWAWRLFRRIERDYPGDFKALERHLQVLAAQGNKTASDILAYQGDYDREGRILVDEFWKRFNTQGAEWAVGVLPVLEYESPALFEGLCVQLKDLAAVGNQAAQRIIDWYAQMEGFRIKPPFKVELFDFESLLSRAFEAVATPAAGGAQDAGQALNHSLRSGSGQARAGGGGGAPRLSRDGTGEAGVGASASGQDGLSILSRKREELEKSLSARRDIDDRGLSDALRDELKAQERLFANTLLTIPTSDKEEYAIQWQMPSAEALQKNASFLRALKSGQRQKIRDALSRRSFGDLDATLREAAEGIETVEVRTLERIEPGDKGWKCISIGNIEAGRAYAQFIRWVLWKKGFHGPKYDISFDSYNIDDDFGINLFNEGPLVNLTAYVKALVREKMRREKGSRDNQAKVDKGLVLLETERALNLIAAWFKENYQDTTYGVNLLALYVGLSQRDRKTYLEALSGADSPGLEIDAAAAPASGAAQHTGQARAGGGAVAAGADGAVPIRQVPEQMPDRFPNGSVDVSIGSADGFVLMQNKSGFPAEVSIGKFFDALRHGKVPPTGPVFSADSPDGGPVRLSSESPDSLRKKFEDALGCKRDAEWVEIEGERIPKYRLNIQKLLNEKKIFWPSDEKGRVEYRIYCEDDIMLVKSSLGEDNALGEYLNMSRWYHKGIAVAPICIIADGENFYYVEKRLESSLESRIRGILYYSHEIDRDAMVRQLGALMEDLGRLLGRITIDEGSWEGYIFVETNKLEHFLVDEENRRIVLTDIATSGNPSTEREDGYALIEDLFSQHIDISGGKWIKDHIDDFRQAFDRGYDAVIKFAPSGEARAPDEYPGGGADFADYGQWGVPPAGGRPQDKLDTSDIVFVQGKENLGSAKIIGRAHNSFIVLYTDGTRKHVPKTEIRDAMAEPLDSAGWAVLLGDSPHDKKMTIGHIIELYVDSYKAAGEHFDKIPQVSPFYASHMINNTKIKREILLRIMLRFYDDGIRPLAERVAQEHQAVRYEFVRMAEEYGDSAEVLDAVRIFENDHWSAIRQTAQRIAAKASADAAQAQDATARAGGEGAVSIESVMRDGRLNILLIETRFSEIATSILREKTGRNDVDARAIFFGSAKYLSDEDGWCMAAAFNDLDGRVIFSLSVGAVLRLEICHEMLSRFISQVTCSNAEREILRAILINKTEGLVPIDPESWPRAHGGLSLAGILEWFKIIAQVGTKTWNTDTLKSAKRYIQLLYYLGDKKIYQKYRDEFVECYDNEEELRNLEQRMREDPYIIGLMETIKTAHKPEDIATLVSRMKENVPWVVGLFGEHLFAAAATAGTAGAAATGAEGAANVASANSAAALLTTPTEQKKFSRICALVHPFYHLDYISLAEWRQWLERWEKYIDEVSLDENAVFVFASSRLYQENFDRVIRSWQEKRLGSEIYELEASGYEDKILLALELKLLMHVLEKLYPEHLAFIPTGLINNEWLWLPYRSLRDKIDPEKTTLELRGVESSACVQALRDDLMFVLNLPIERTKIEPREGVDGPVGISFYGDRENNSWPTEAERLEKIEQLERGTISRSQYFSWLRERLRRYRGRTKGHLFKSEHGRPIPLALVKTYLNDTSHYGKYYGEFGLSRFPRLIQQSRKSTNRMANLVLLSNKLEIFMGIAEFVEDPISCYRPLNKRIQTPDAGFDFELALPWDATEDEVFLYRHRLLEQLAGRKLNGQQLDEAAAEVKALADFYRPGLRVLAQENVDSGGRYRPETIGLFWKAISSASVAVAAQGAKARAGGEDLQKSVEAEVNRILDTGRFQLSRTAKKHTIAIEIARSLAPRLANKGSLAEREVSSIFRRHGINLRKQDISDITRRLNTLSDVRTTDGDWLLNALFLRFDRIYETFVNLTDLMEQNFIRLKQNGPITIEAMRRLFESRQREIFGLIHRMLDLHEEVAILSDNEKVYLDVNLSRESGGNFCQWLTACTSSALNTAGIPAEIKYIETGKWVHFYVVVKIEGQDVAIDFTSGQFIPENAGRIVVASAEEHRRQLLSAMLQNSSQEKLDEVFAERQRLREQLRTIIERETIKIKKQPFEASPLRYSRLKEECEKIPFVISSKPRRNPQMILVEELAAAITRFRLARASAAGGQAQDAGQAPNHSLRSGTGQARAGGGTKGKPQGELSTSDIVFVQGKENLGPAKITDRVHNSFVVLYTDGTNKHVPKTEVRDAMAEPLDSAGWALLLGDSPHDKEMTIGHIIKLYINSFEGARQGLGMVQNESPVFTHRLIKNTEIKREILFRVMARFYGSGMQRLAEMVAKEHQTVRYEFVRMAKQHGDSAEVLDAVRIFENDHWNVIRQTAQRIRAKATAAGTAGEVPSDQISDAVARGANGQANARGGPSKNPGSERLRELIKNHKGNLENITMELQEVDKIATRPRTVGGWIDGDKSLKAAAAKVRVRPRPPSKHPGAARLRELIVKHKGGLPGIKGELESVDEIKVDKGRVSVWITSDKGLDALAKRLRPKQEPKTAPSPLSKKPADERLKQIMLKHRAHLESIVAELKSTDGIDVESGTVSSWIRGNKKLNELAKKLRAQRITPEQFKKIMVDCNWDVKKAQRRLSEEYGPCGHFLQFVKKQGDEHIAILKAGVEVLLEEKKGNYSAAARTLNITVLVFRKLWIPALGITRPAEGKKAPERAKWSSISEEEFVNLMKKHNWVINNEDLQRELKLGPGNFFLTFVAVHGFQNVLMAKIFEVIEEKKGNLKQTADYFGISRRQFYEWLIVLRFSGDFFEARRAIREKHWAKSKAEREKRKSAAKKEREPLLRGADLYRRNFSGTEAMDRNREKQLAYLAMTGDKNTATQARDALIVEGERYVYRAAQSVFYSARLKLPQTAKPLELEWLIAEGNIILLEELPHWYPYAANDSLEKHMMRVLISKLWSRVWEVARTDLTEVSLSTRSVLYGEYGESEGEERGDHLADPAVMRDWLGFFGEDPADHGFGEEEPTQQLLTLSGEEKEKFEEGLQNLTFFAEDVQHFLVAGKPATIALVDVDNTGYLNKIYGRPMVTRMLADIILTATEMVSEYSDAVDIHRYSAYNDSFVLIFNGNMTGDEINAVLAKIRKKIPEQIRAKYDEKSERALFTISIGHLPLRRMIELCDENGRSVKEFLELSLEEQMDIVMQDMPKFLSLALDAAKDLRGRGKVLSLDVRSFHRIHPLADISYHDEGDAGTAADATGAVAQASGMRVLAVADVVQNARDIEKMIQAIEAEHDLKVEITPFDISEVQGEGLTVIEAIRKKADEMHADRIIINIYDNGSGLAESIRSYFDACGIEAVNITGLDDNDAREAIKTSL